MFGNLLSWTFSCDSLACLAVSFRLEEILEKRFEFAALCA